MASEETRSPVNIALGSLSAANWPVRQDGDKIVLVDGAQEITLLEKQKKGWVLKLVYLDREENKYKPQSGITEVRFDPTIVLSDIIYFRRTGNYKLTVAPIQKVLRDKFGTVTTLLIGPRGRDISYSSKKLTVTMSTDFYLSVLQDVRDVLQKGRSYKGSVQRYLFNQVALNRFAQQTQQTTSIQKGEFRFLIHRFNIETKQKREDFERYLGPEDAEALQQMFSGMLAKGAFSPEYLRVLDDHFIKEKLTDVINLGRDILSLRSADLSTDKAIAVIDKLNEVKKPKQLEALWQRYFEKNLLYLIFSYKEIFPKVKLKLDGDKKYPDFVGINHYYGVDAIEIKHHLLPALVWDGSHKNFSFSPALSKAIIQTMNYMDAIKQERFKAARDKARITESTNIENLYRPRGIIIISSWDRLIGDKSVLQTEKEKMFRDFTKLRNSLHNIEILTFDEVIDVAQNYAGHFIKTQSKPAAG